MFERRCRRVRYKAGNWLVRCDTCGFIYENDKMQKEWTGAIVCQWCYTPQHELDKPQRPPIERKRPPIIRPGDPDE